MTSRAHILWAIGTLAPLAVLFACSKPYKPGMPCPPEVPPGVGFCVDSDTFLLCGEDKRFLGQTIPCRGSKGCFGKKPDTLQNACDFSGDAAGDFCATVTGECTETPRACSADGKSMIVCSCGKTPSFEILPCRGPKGCVQDPLARGRQGDAGAVASAGAPSAGLAVCDDTIADINDACDAKITDTRYTCGSDPATMLVCDKDKNKWKLARTCKGPKHCAARWRAADCDSTYADIMDPCEADGLQACSVDRASSLVCKGGRYLEAASCKGPDFCRATQVGAAYNIECEKLPNPVNQKGPRPVPPMPMPSGSASAGR